MMYKLLENLKITQSFDLENESVHEYIDGITFPSNSLNLIRSNIIPELLNKRKNVFYEEINRIQKKYSNRNRDKIIFKGGLILKNPRSYKINPGDISIMGENGIFIEDDDNMLSDITLDLRINLNLSASYSGINWTGSLENSLFNLESLLVKPYWYFFDPTEKDYDTNFKYFEKSIRSLVNKWANSGSVRHNGVLYSSYIDKSQLEFFYKTNKIQSLVIDNQINNLNKFDTILKDSVDFLTNDNLITKNEITLLNNLYVLTNEIKFLDLGSSNVLLNVDPNIGLIKSFKNDPYVNSYLTYIPTDDYSNPIEKMNVTEKIISIDKKYKLDDILNDSLHFFWSVRERKLIQIESFKNPSISLYLDTSSYITYNSRSLRNEIDFLPEASFNIVGQHPNLKVIGNDINIYNASHYIYALRYTNNESYINALNFISNSLLEFKSSSIYNIDYNNLPENVSQELIDSYFVPMIVNQELYLNTEAEMNNFPPIVLPDFNENNSFSLFNDNLLFLANNFIDTNYSYLSFIEKFVNYQNQYKNEDYLYFRSNNNLLNIETFEINNNIKNTDISLTKLIATSSLIDDYINLIRNRKLNLPVTYSIIKNLYSTYSLYDENRNGDNNSFEYFRDLNEYMHNWVNEIRIDILDAIRYNKEYDIENTSSTVDEETEVIETHPLQYFPVQGTMYNPLYLWPTSSDYIYYLNNNISNLTNLILEDDTYYLTSSILNRLSKVQKRNNIYNILSETTSYIDKLKVVKNAVVRSGDFNYPWQHIVDDAKSKINPFTPFKTKLYFNGSEKFNTSSIFTGKFLKNFYTESKTIVKDFTKGLFEKFGDDSLKHYNNFNFDNFFTFVSESVAGKNIVNYYSNFDKIKLNYFNNVISGSFVTSGNYNYEFVFSKNSSELEDRTITTIIYSLKRNIIFESIKNKFKILINSKNKYLNAFSNNVYYFEKNNVLTILLKYQENFVVINNVFLDLNYLYNSFNLPLESNGIIKQFSNLKFLLNKINNVLDFILNKKDETNLINEFINNNEIYFGVLLIINKKLKSIKERNLLNNNLNNFYVKFDEDTYYLNNNIDPTLLFIKNKIYEFDLSNISLKGINNVIVISENSQSGNYSSGLVLNGILPGNFGSKATFNVPGNAPNKLYYYYPNYLGNWGEINIKEIGDKAFEWLDINQKLPLSMSADIQSMYNTGSLNVFPYTSSVNTEMLWGNLAKGFIKHSILDKTKDHYMEHFDELVNKHFIKKIYLKRTDIDIINGKLNIYLSNIKK